MTEPEPLTDDFTDSQMSKQLISVDTAQFPVSAAASHALLTNTQPCIPPGLLNRAPASAGVKMGKSPLPLAGNTMWSYMVCDWFPWTAISALFYWLNRVRVPASARVKTGKSPLPVAGNTVWSYMACDWSPRTAISTLFYLHACTPVNQVRYFTYSKQTPTRTFCCVTLNKSPKQSRNETCKKHKKWWCLISRMLMTRWHGNAFVSY